MDTIEQQLEASINAIDMQPGQMYMSVNSSEPIKLRIHGVLDDKVIVESFSKYHGKWLKVKVDRDYQVRLQRKEEIKMSETTVATENKKEVKKQNVGLVSGLKMLAAWGKNFQEFGNKPDARQNIINSMLADFPEKSESINKWVDAYKAYYNTGRLPVAKPEVKVTWEDSKSAARAAAKVAKGEERARIKAEKAALKEAAKEEKMKARAQKAADREAALQAKADAAAAKQTADAVAKE